MRPFLSLTVLTTLSTPLGAGRGGVEIDAALSSESASQRGHILEPVGKGVHNSRKQQRLPAMEHCLSQAEMLAHDYNGRTPNRVEKERWAFQGRWRRHCLGRNMAILTVNQGD